MDKPLTIDEQLSAFADGELPPAETALLLARLDREPELRARWERYHTIGEALRDGLPARFPAGLVAGVAAAIADDPGHARARGAGLGRWLKPVAGVAVAASVALVGVLVVRQQIGTPSAPVAPLTAGAERTTTAGAVMVDYSPAMQARLGAYVVRHGERAGRALPAVAPHARVAAKEAEEVPAAAPATQADAAAPAATPPP